MCGIEMSSTMTSGRETSAARSADGPSCAVPTTTQAGASTARARARMASLSSTRRTRGRSDKLVIDVIDFDVQRVAVDSRIGLGGGPTVLATLDNGERNRGLHPSATARAGADLESAANRFQSLFHADEAETFRPHGIEVKAHAIVDDAQGEAGRASSEMHRDLFGVAVFDRVLERLLNDPEQT